MHTIHIALGSNIGDRQKTNREAISQLATAVTRLERSPIYETEPWGYGDQVGFLNRVVRGATQLTPSALLGYLKRIEHNIGRTPSFLNGPREIDLDILFYDDLILENENLLIPHPRLHDRAFVLVPLGEIAAEFRHPIWNLTISDLRRQVDRSKIIRIEESTWVEPTTPSRCLARPHHDSDGPGPCQRVHRAPALVR